VGAIANLSRKYHKFGILTFSASYYMFQHHISYTPSSVIGMYVKKYTFWWIAKFLDG